MSAAWVKGMTWQVWFLSLVLIGPSASAQDQVPQFDIDATVGNTDFDLMPGIYHKVPVSVDVTCKVWSPMMQAVPMNFYNVVDVEGVPEKKRLFLEVDDPSTDIIFTATDCVEGIVKTYAFTITIQPGKVFDAFVPFTFQLDITAKRGTGEDRETWEMRTGFAGDVYFVSHRVGDGHRITDPGEHVVHISIGNWGNAEIAGHLQMNESRPGEVTMDPFEFGPIPHNSVKRASSWGLPIRVTEAAVADPGLYPLVVDAFAYPVAEPDYPIPMQTMEVIIDTRPFGWEYSNGEASSGLLIWSLLVVVGMSLLSARRAR
ncbi:MAG: hypothetical protein KY455_02070 [Euryarchaeota archaeon]|nr:hypothetical protein [Euryarchaeota archaeon]